MIKCALCGEEFNNNLGGQLTNHLIHFHNITMEEYVVITEYGGIAPICQCGCLETPTFYRGKFKKYYIGHNTFKFRETQYIEKYGMPVCENCGDSVTFYRAIPTNLCEKCRYKLLNALGNRDRKYYPFMNPKIQEKIKNTVKEKYGVDNISKVPEIKQKIKKHIKENPRPIHIHTEDQLKMMSESAKNNWKNEDYRTRTMNSLKIACNKPEERERRSRVQKEHWANKNKLPSSPFYQSSKLHMNIRDELNLSAYGFLQEQIVGGLVADELHPDKKLIIEINGDFWHANPDIYSANDIIKAPGEAFVAGDKWKIDFQKYKKYAELGYDLIVIWEADYKEDKTLATYKELLRNIFGY